MTRYNTVIYGAWAFAHRLPRTDLDLITAHGRVPAALQWAPPGLTYDSTTAFLSGIDGWGGFGVVTPTFNQTVGGRDACLVFAITSGGTNHIINKVALPRGKRVRITLEVFRPASNETVTGVILQPYNQASGRQIVQLAGDTWTPLTMDVEDTGAAGSSAEILLYMMNAGGSFSFAGNGTDTVAIRNVKVQRLGAFCALDFGAGGGSQAADSSGNAFHVQLQTPFEHVVPERRFQIFQRVSLSGNNPSVSIPTNARIVSITANAAGSVTLSVGNVGSGTQIVNAQALTTGIQDVTLAGRFSTTGNLVANLTSGVQVDLTFDCVMTGP